MRQDTNIIALVKGTERYVFVFADDRRDDLCSTLGRFAADPDLAFTWYDAAALGDKIREHDEMEKGNAE